MTADLVGLTADDRLAETIGDAALASLLRSKPAEEDIPAAVWWLLAETLRTSATIRQALDGLEHANGTDRRRQPAETELRVLIAEATLLADAALGELGEATGARPVPVPLPAAVPGRPAPTASRRAAGLQLSVLFLARLLVSHTPTSGQRLANGLAAHVRALRQLEPRLAI